MKRLFVFFLVAVSFITKAQDTLITWGGKAYAVKIKKVTTFKIQYTKVDNSNPVYSTWKENVAEIHYANGYKEKCEPPLNMAGKENFNLFPDYEAEQREEQIKDTFAQKIHNRRFACISLGPGYCNVGRNHTALGGGLGLLFAKGKLAISSDLGIYNNLDSSNTTSLGYLSLKMGFSFKARYLYGSFTGGLSAVSFEGFSWANGHSYWGGGGNGPGSYYSYKYRDNRIFYDGIGVPLEVKCFWLSKKGLGGGFTLAANLCIFNSSNTKHSTNDTVGGSPLSGCLNFVWRFKEE